MSDRAVQPHPNGSEMSGKYLTVKESAWMRHWMQAKRTRPRDDNLGLEDKDMHKTNQHSSLCMKGSKPCELRAFFKLTEGTETRASEAVNKVMTDGSQRKKERSDLLFFPVCNIHKRGGSTNDQVPGTQIGQCSEFDAATTATKKPRCAYASGHQLQETGITTRGSKLFPKEMIPNVDLELRAHDSIDDGCMPAVKSSQDKLLGVSSSNPYGIMYRKETVIPFAFTSKEHITHLSSYNDFKNDTLRVASTLDAREDIHFGSPMYAETTRHFWVTEKMAIGVSDEGKIFRESMLSAKFNGNLSGFLGLSSASGQVRPGLKLQLLDGSTDSEHICRGTEENQKDEGSRSIGRLSTMGALMDETSAETRTMEVYASLENNHNHGLAVSRSNQATLRGLSTVSSQGKSANTGLPDMNEVAPALDGLVNGVEPSTSRTQSLDMESLFSNNDRPSNILSMPSHVVQPQAELGSRWVKRLKLSGSVTKYLTLGTKSSAVEEASAYKKLRKLSSNLFNRSIGPTNLELSMNTHLRNTSESYKKIAEDPNISNIGKCSSTDSLKEDSNAVWSHSWIKRWRHAQNASSNKQLVHTEPSETPKAIYDHFEKKTFPSIAAMALMGKAMNGFRPCEFSKKGYCASASSVVPPTPPKHISIHHCCSQERYCSIST